MILADTSVWIDHFRGDTVELVSRLKDGRVVSHPFVVGELACGNLWSRATTLKWLDRLPQVALATPCVVREAIERRKLSGRGIGYIDAHLLASALLSPPVHLWTRDKRLHAVAVELGVAYLPENIH